MKVLFFFFVFGVYCAFGQEKDTTKIYILSEVDVAPLFPKLRIIDSLTSKQNFEKNLRYQVLKNIEIVTNNHILNKVFVEFLIKKDGNIEVLRVRGGSKAVKESAIRAVERIEKIIPAKKDSQPVTMRSIIPITFKPVIIFEFKKEYE